jgi:hypothetical protein
MSLALLTQPVSQWNLVMVTCFASVSLSLSSCLQDPAMSITNTSLLVDVTSNNVVEIWAQVQPSCVSAKV